MIRDYYSVITNIEHFIDAILIVDKNYNIIYHKNFGISKYTFNEKYFLDKKPWDIFVNIEKEKSTLYKALKYGEKTKLKKQTLTFDDGKSLEVLDTTFPIKINNEIIGAISTSIIIDDDYVKDFIEISNITYSKNNYLYELKDIIGKSKEMQNLKYKINKVSQTNSNVLIYGQTGTGKELVAQSIHSCSKRRNKPFVSQNCAAIPETLLESIFFGTTKGSYTGAENKPGIFESAEGGTIFLDEINSMSINMQAKLLRAIEEKKITRIGAIEPKKVDVRIIAAINENPHKCIKENKIKEDLFYRLSSILINVPSLKDRKSDISILTDYFIDFYNHEMNMNIKGVTDEVKDILYKYSWPGNTREFKNTIEGAFNFSTSNFITKEDLPEYIQESCNYLDYEKNINISKDINNISSLSDAISEFEKQFILSKSKGVRSLSHLADILQISRQTLNYKIKKYKLNIPIE